MPGYLQGNIFQEQNNYDLVVVFGHVGFNEMGSSWRDFRDRVRQFNNINDPFTELSGLPQHIGRNQWIWFIPEEENGGMTDYRLQGRMHELMELAQANGIKTVITNGIANVDHGRGRASDDQRARFFSALATEHEQQGVQITLISLNDIYVRNAQ